MPEKHLRQSAVPSKPGFTQNACGPFTKSKERLWKLTDSRYIYQNELDKTCFQHDTAYGYFKDLTRTTTSDKVFSSKAFDIAKNSQYDGYQKGLASIVCKFLDKSTAVIY